MLGTVENPAASVEGSNPDCERAMALREPAHLQLWGCLILPSYLSYSCHRGHCIFHVISLGLKIKKRGKKEKGFCVNEGMEDAQNLA